MGILTLLRNAFGRSRKGRSAEEEPTREPQVPAQPTEPEPAVTSAEVPEQSLGRTDEHDLVAAAFDSVTVPRQPTHREEPPATRTPDRKPVAETAPEPTAEAEPEAEAEPAAEATTEPEAESEAAPEA